MNLPSDYPPATLGKIVVWGLMASQPFGGMIWQAWHYLVGLRRLGVDVWYVEDSDRRVLDPARLWPTSDYGPNVAHLESFMRSVGLGDRWVFRPPGIHDLCLGATDISGLSRLYREADAVINLCGAQELRPDHREIRCLIYLQTDPTADQVRVALGDSNTLAELDPYHALFTYGENIGTEGCLLPVERYRWHTTRPPVIVDWWKSNGALGTTPKLTTITNWKKYPNKDVAWRGETWRWNKQDEIRRFIKLPARSALPLELAITSIEEADKDLLRKNGWRLQQATSLNDPDAYHSYIQNSQGELTVAKEQYVLPRTGWFSDRSVCYLAAGRPVVAQNTAFGRHIPTGEGLFAFDTEDEALTAIESVASDYTRHSEAARSLAREYFGSDEVLSDLLAKAGLLS